LAQEKHFYPQSALIYIRSLPYVFVCLFFFNRVGVDPDEDLKAEAASQVCQDFRHTCWIKNCSTVGRSCLSKIML